MMKALKITGYVLAGMALLLSTGAAFIHFRGLPTFNVQPPDFQLNADSARIEEGRRLVSLSCAHCHQGQDGRLSGQYRPDMSSPEFGEVYSANITQDPEAGIGNHTDGQLALLLRSGIKKDGKLALPMMPRFNHLSDEDMQAIIAFLRSGQEPVQASATYQPPYQPTFLAKILGNLVFKPLPYPEKTVVAPPASDEVAYGRYLLTGRFDCYGCHSSSFQTVNLLEPEKSSGFLGGGNPLVGEEGKTVFSANLTPDRETGLGRWTEAQFMDAVKFGKKPGGGSLRQPMMPFAAMTDQEARAIWAYLQTVPVIVNPIRRD